VGPGIAAVVVVSVGGVIRLVIVVRAAGHRRWGHPARQRHARGGAGIGVIGLVIVVCAAAAGR
jgi:hypothetical protein